MQKLQKKTHNVLSKMRNNASFQLYAPEDDKTGNMSALLGPADSCAGLAKKCVLVALTNHSFTWKDAFPLCCLARFWIPVTGKLYVKLLALEDVRCLGLESISGLGSFLAAESSGNNGLDRMCGGAYIVAEGQSLFGPPSDHLAAVEKRMWTRSSCMRSIAATPTATRYTSSTSTPYPCAS